MTWGMPTYEVPLATYPDTYNGKPLMYAAFASQKRYMTVHLMGLDASIGSRTVVPRGVRGTCRADAPDMGVGCVRFRRLEELPLDLIGIADRVHRRGWRSWSVSRSARSTRR